MEPLPIMLFSFMFGFPLYRIVPLPGYFGGYCLVCGDFDMGASGRFASKFFCLQTERFDLAATGAFNIHLFCFTA